MPWGTSEGGIPQPYRMEVVNSHFEKKRDRDGNLISSRNGDNLLTLVWEGNRSRLEETESGFEVGEVIEPYEGKYNIRRFDVGWTNTYVDVREDGSQVEHVASPMDQDESMPRTTMGIGRLINSLVELVGADELNESWDSWYKASAWQGRTFDLAPKHDIDKSGNPVTRRGDDQIDWYYEIIAIVDQESAKEPETGEADKPSRRSRSKRSDDGLLKTLQADFKAYQGNEDEFVNFIQSDEYPQHEVLAKLNDDAFDALVDKAVG